MYMKNDTLYMKKWHILKIGNEGSITDAVQEIIEAFT